MPPVFLGANRSRSIVVRTEVGALLRRAANSLLYSRPTRQVEPVRWATYSQALGYASVLGSGCSTAEPKRLKNLYLSIFVGMTIRILCGS